MRNLKKLASLLLALVMVLSLTVTASAYTIKLNGSADTPVDGHSYTVYQIFTGDLAFDEDGKSLLSNIKYGEHYHPDEAEKGTAVSEDVINGITDAKTFAKDLISGSDLETSSLVLNSSNNYTLTDVAAGYYLIVDNGGEDMSDNDSLSAYIVEVVDNVDIFPKSGTITSDKTISEDDYQDNNDVNEDKVNDDSVAQGGKNNNSAIGSTVDYTLTVTLPANAGSYSYYYCVLNDTLAPGLSFNADSVVVKVSGKDAALEKGAGKDYILYTGEDAGDYTFQIAMLNASTLAGKTITVTYNATVTKDAILGIEGNPNKFTVDFSNNPNFDYDDEHKDGKPDDDDKSAIGTTPEKETITYVTGVKLKKVNEAQQILPGAEFEISGTSIKHIKITGTEFEKVETNTGTHYKLKDGTYTETAPLTEDKYEAKSGERDGGYVKDGETFRIATKEELADGNKQLYVKIFANEDLYETTTKDYKKVTLDKIIEEPTDFKATAFVGEDGTVSFDGLGEGIYTIKEITTPAGYNTIADITLEIQWEAPAEGSKTCTWKAYASNAVTDENPTGAIQLNTNGEFEMTVVNKSGSTLPETGGMGTTLFYIAGGILVLAAVVLLVTKKRMQNAE